MATTTSYIIILILLIFSLAIYLEVKSPFYKGKFEFLSSFLYATITFIVSSILAVGITYFYLSYHYKSSYPEAENTIMLFLIIVMLLLIGGVSYWFNKKTSFLNLSKFWSFIFYSLYMVITSIILIFAVLSTTN